MLNKELLDVMVDCLESLASPDDYIHTYIHNEGCSARLIKRKSDIEIKADYREGSLSLLGHQPAPSEDYYSWSFMYELLERVEVSLEEMSKSKHDTDTHNELKRIISEGFGTLDSMNVKSYLSKIQPYLNVMLE